MLSSTKSTAQTTYWYNNGIPDSVFYRTDIVSFKCNGGIAYNGSYNSLIIDSIVFRANRRDKANEVYFNPSSTLLQRLTESQTIYLSGQVEIIYPNISKTLQGTYSITKLYTIDNLILVNFTDPYPTNSDLNTFMTQFDLTLYSAPSNSLPTTTSPSYTYIFEAHPTVNSNNNINYEYLAGLLRDIYLNSTIIAVTGVSPNIITTSPSLMQEPPSGGGSGSSEGSIIGNRNI